MKRVRSCCLLFVAVWLVGPSAGCGGRGPEALPTANTPNYDTGDITKVEGLQERPRKKGLQEAPKAFRMP